MRVMATVVMGVVRWSQVVGPNESMKQTVFIGFYCFREFYHLLGWFMKICIFVKMLLFMY